ncbi:MAG: nuclear transport factor 2 family protein [Cyanothece sp. SIO1E1]|nr:nuclear transport factor 2 family protein [Cyanothece sp. SIO1E1]
MNKHSELQIAELEERLRQAMLTSNVTELDILIAPELLFTSHLGQLISKAEDLAIHRSGTLKLTQITPSDQYIQTHEGFSVVSVQMHLLGVYAGKAIDEHIRYTRVWSLSSAGSLQIVAGHASVVSI